MILKSDAKFEQKLTCGLIKNFKFYCLLYLKGKLLKPKTSTVRSCYDTEEQKVWAKTESWFPSQPKNNLVSLFPEGEKGQIFKFHWVVLSKRQIA